MDTVDVILLSHNRLAYLEKTVEALFERTPEPFRLTVVDNASGPDVRNWLAANRHRFHRLITLPRNEHVPAFQQGIEATTSDPYVVSDPDIELPQLEPSWLARLRDVLERHPEYGLVGVAFAGQELPETETDVVEGNVGTWFQMIRRDALREPYVKDSLACQAVRDAGYRVGWTPAVVAHHLGRGDPERYPGHVAAKNELVSARVRRDELSPYPFYWRQLERIGRPASLTEIARAAPLIGEIRAAGVEPGAILELAWSEPAVAAVIPEAVAVFPPPSPLPLADGAAGAVVLMDPPDLELLPEALRVAAKLVLLVCGLTEVDGRLADDLAPSGWTATERPGPAEVVLELARLGDELPELAGGERFTTLQHREEWLALFGAGAFGGSARLFVFTRSSPLPVPDRVEHGPELGAWRPPARVAPAPAQRSIAARAVSRLRRLRMRASLAEWSNQ